MELEGEDADEKGTRLGRCEGFERNEVASRTLLRVRPCGEHERENVNVI